MGKVISFVLGTLMVAVVVHIASVWLLPRAIMYRTIARIGEAGMNEIRFGKRPDASAHGVVRPSPDLLYSTCAYDLAAGPLRVHSPVPSDTYWSVSLFDSATNNYYVLDDRQAHARKQKAVDFIIVEQPAIAITSPGYDAPTVQSPSTRGLVLFRTLINDEKNLAAIDSFRRGASCSTWHAPSQGARDNKA